MTAGMETRTVLPDGSVALVRPIDARTSIVSRLVAGTVAWGQVFSSDEDHDGQVCAVVSSMVADPAAFRRWWL